MKATDFHLPENAERQLAEIFTDQYMEAVKSACRRYLHETADKKPGVADDGRTLMEISEKAIELRRLLKKSESALGRVHLHVSEEFKKHDTLIWIDDLKKRLKVLDDMCFVNPARDRAANPSKGRPAGSVKAAERALAFMLWEFYRQAHGEPARRVTIKRDVSDDEDYKEKSCEVGPLPKAAAILGPVLKLPSDLSRYFREIGKEYMDNKSKSP